MQFTFQNNIKYSLSAILDLPSGNPPFPIVIFSHGFDSSKDSPRTVPISLELQKNGVASFRFDYTGHGDSDGFKNESTAEQQFEDLKSAIEKVKHTERLDNKRIALHGSSSGCLSILREIESINYSAAVLRAPRTDGFYPDIKAKGCKIDTPILAIQGENDPLIKKTEIFLKEIPAQKKLVVIREADHLFSQPKQFEQVKNITVTWLTKVLKEDAKAA